MVTKKQALKVSGLSALAITIATYFIDVYTWVKWDDAIAPYYTAIFVGALVFGISYFGMIKK